MDDQKTCFVIQGFGEKTDYRTGRKLNLDASYEVMKEAVEDAGLECIRADEIQHSQVIDKPMYEQILNADLVIADLSTSNVNAAYELGVRHALRPRTTIIVAEDQWDFPFDINRNAIRTYEHLGPDLGRREAKKFAQMLTEAIQAILDDDAVDSPLYTFLPDLQPPRKGEPEALAFGVQKGAAEAKAPAAEEGPAVKAFTDQAKTAMAADNFAMAKSMLEAAKGLRPNDESIIQKLVLATYKSKAPNELDALREAHDLILQELDPVRSNDPETIGLWAAVHKRLWSLTEDQIDLQETVDALERGFRLKGDFYNGINLAFSLNLRTQLADTPPAAAVADYVQAQRVRRKVIDICRNLLAAGTEDPAEKYWVLATRWEAAFGLEDTVEAARWEQLTREHWQANQEPPNQLPVWMIESTEEQIEKLEGFLTPSPLRFIAAG